MKKYNAIFYLLFILLVMGAFASMAQNSYGLKIMIGVAFAFAVVFLVQFISALLNRDKKNPYTLIEPACLFSLSFVFSLRALNMRFPYIELLFVIAGILLILIFMRKMISRYNIFKPKNKLLSIHVLVFHSSIILFLFSIVLIPFAQKVAEALGTIAFILLVVFIIAGFLKKNLLVDGVKVSPFSMVINFNDHSVVIGSICLLFSLFIGLNKFGVLPEIYSDEYPQAYFDLVNKAVSGKEKPVDGKYKYEIFKEKYDQFLKYNNIKEQ